MTLSNKEIVQAVFDASAASDFDTVKSHLHPDIKIHEADSLPYPGVFEGPDGFVALNQQVFSAWADAKNVIHHILADGDHVIILGNMEGKGKTTGIPFSVPLCAVWRFEGDKVIEVRPFYFDTKAMHDAHVGT